MFKKNIFFKDIQRQLRQNIIPRVDLHNHTNWTDGNNTVEEMYIQAIKKLLHFFIANIRERKVVNGLMSSQTSKNFKSKCKPLVGTEVKVLDFKGNIDLSKDIKKM